MLAKLLKRKESRHVLQQTQTQEPQEKSSNKNGTIQNQQQQPQYRYQRPDLLGKVSNNTPWGGNGIEKTRLKNSSVLRCRPRLFEMQCAALALRCTCNSLAMLSNAQHFGKV